MERRSLLSVWLCIIGAAVPAMARAAPPERRYMMLVLDRPETNKVLVQAVRTSIANLADKTGLHIATQAELPAGKTPEQAMRDCHAQLGCLADYAAQAKTDAVIIARVMVSKVVSGGVVMQFLVVNNASHAVVRKCGIEVGVLDDADVAVRASYLSLFGRELPLGLGGERFTSRAQIFALMKTQINDMETRLAALGASSPTQEDMDLMDDVVSSMQTLLALFQSQLYEMDSQSVPRWLRGPHPPPAGPANAADGP